MKLIMLNFRGCNKPFKQKEIKIVLQNSKVDLCVLLETRVQIGKFTKIFSIVFRGWKCENNYDFLLMVGFVSVVTFIR